MLQKGLDWIGLAPGIGEFFDGANAVVYVAQKDWGNAFISAAAMVPFWGNLGTGARIAKNTGRETKEISQAAAPRFITTGSGKAIDRQSINTSISMQRQGRHVMGAPQYKEGSYFSSADDAQKVLDDFHSGHADVLGLKRITMLLLEPQT